MGGLFSLPPEGLDEEWRTNPEWKVGRGECADTAVNVNVSKEPPIGITALVHETAHGCSIVHAVSVRCC